MDTPSSIIEITGSSSILNILRNSSNLSISNLLKALSLINPKRNEQSLISIFSRNSTRIVNSSYKLLPVNSFSMLLPIVRTINAAS